MLPFNIARTLATAIANLVGYPPALSEDLRGRLLR